MANEQNSDQAVDLNTLLKLLPTTWQKNLPIWVQVGGVVFGSLALGYQKMSELYPDSVNVLSGAPTYMGLASAIAVVVGLVMHKGVVNQTTNAAKVAAMSPPVKSDGTMDAMHTFSMGIQQAASSGDIARAKAVLDAIVAHEKSLPANQGGQS